MKNAGSTKPKSNDPLQAQKRLKIWAVIIVACFVVALLASSTVRLALLSNFLKNKKTVAGNPVATTSADTTGVNDNTLPAETTAAPTTSPSSSTTAAPVPTTTSGGNSDTTTTTEETTAPPVVNPDSPAVQKQKKAIVTAYKTIVNASKSNSKPGFTKIEYRTLSGDNTLSKVLGAPVADSMKTYFIKEADARANPIVVKQGSAMTDLCMNNKYYACLADPSNASFAVKSASSVKNSDGTVTITIVLRDEANPEATSATAKTAASKTGGFFNVVSPSAATGAIQSKFKISTVNSVTLSYSGCTLKLVYNPGNKRILSLKQTMVYKADVAVKVFNFIDSSGSGTVTDISEYKGFSY